MFLKNNSGLLQLGSFCHFWLKCCIWSFGHTVLALTNVLHTVHRLLHTASATQIFRKKFETFRYFMFPGFFFTASFGRLPIPVDPWNSEKPLAGMCVTSSAYTHVHVHPRVNAQQLTTTGAHNRNIALHSAAGGQTAMPKVPKTAALWCSISLVPQRYKFWNLATALSD